MCVYVLTNNQLRSINNYRLEKNYLLLTTHNNYLYKSPRHILDDHSALNQDITYCPSIIKLRSVKLNYILPIKN